MIATYTKDRDYEVLLCEYAAGGLDEPCSLIIATHITLCTESRHMLHIYEQVGGAFLEMCEETALTDQLLDTVMGRLDEEEGTADNTLIAPEGLGFPMPKPLEPYIANTAEHPLKWKKTLPGMMTCDLKIDSSDNAVRIIKMEPGASVPSHGHGGQELTLVIDGAMTDEHGSYEVGDLIIQDEGFEHTPVAHAEYGCICLTVSCAPIKLKGLASLLNPFLSK